MKLKNKLLPFVGIAALGATFAPIALTSCKSGSTNGAIDLREWYTPTIEKHAYTTLTEDQAARLYFCGDENADWGDWLDEDEMNERLTQDYLFGASIYVQSLEQNGIAFTGDDLVNKLGDLTTKVAEEEYFEGFGLEGIANLTSENSKASSEAAPLVAKSHVEYNTYNVTLSDVRVSHATNYYIPEYPVEVPTISFELEFDIDCTVTTIGKSKDGRRTEMHYIGGGEIPSVFEEITTTTEQNHKGSITVMNVPVVLEYEYYDGIDTKGWTINFDEDTIVESELSTSKIPFSIFGTDNVTYTTDAKFDSRSQHNSGTRVYDFDYYSGMLWENQVSPILIAHAATTAQAVYDEAIKTQTEAVAKALATRAYNYEILSGYDYTGASGRIGSGAVYNTVGHCNYSFFGSLSYYLLSVAHI